MAKEKVKTDYEIAVEDFENAVRERNRARQMFDYATADYFEIACEELKASELKVSICQKKFGS